MFTLSPQQAAVQVPPEDRKRFMRVLSSILSGSCHVAVSPTAFSAAVVAVLNEVADAARLAATAAKAPRTQPHRAKTRAATHQPYAAEAKGWVNPAAAPVGIEAVVDDQCYDALAAVVAKADAARAARRPPSGAECRALIRAQQERAAALPLWPAAEAALARRQAARRQADVAAIWREVGAEAAEATAEDAEVLRDSGIEREALLARRRRGRDLATLARGDKGRFAAVDTRVDPVDVAVDMAKRAAKNPAALAEAEKAWALAAHAARLAMREAAVRRELAAQ